MWSWWLTLLSISLACSGRLLPAGQDIVPADAATEAPSVQAYDAESDEGEAFLFLLEEAYTQRRRELQVSLT